MFSHMGWMRQLDLTKRIVGVTASEITANIRALNLYPFGFFQYRDSATPHPQFATNKRPILFVHGVVHNSSAFIPLKRRMTDESWKNIFSFNYSTSHGSLTKMVDILARKVDEVVERTGSPQIDIVAHSLGGIISRYYMCVGSGRGRVHHLVTIGTPHQGTPMSFLLRMGLFGGLNSDLRSGSYVIRHLNETALPRGARLTSIYSKYDLIAWGENCRVEGLPRKAFANHEIPDVGHLGLLYSAEAIHAVLLALTAEDSSQLSVEQVDSLR